jgi:ketosteroid isomerase-like protein
MRIWLLCAVVLAGAGAPEPKEASDVAELTRLEAVWNEAHKRGDAEALDGLWADDLVVSVPRMAVLTRPDALAVARSGRMKFQRYDTSELRVRVYGDAAVVTGRLQRTRDMGGRVLDDDWRFTKVYVRHEGRWQVVAFHASEAAQ